MATLHHRRAQSALALTLTGVVTIGSTFFAGAAGAAEKPSLDLKSETAVEAAVTENLANSRGLLPVEVGRFGSDGTTLYLGVSKSTAAVKEFDAEFANVEVEVSSKYRQAEPQRRQDIVGGAGYIFQPPESSENVCSTGFAGWDKATGKQVILSAGHCGSLRGESVRIVDMERPMSSTAGGGSGLARFATGKPGNWRWHQFGSPMLFDQIDDLNKAYDVSVIDVDDYFTVKPEITDWTTADRDDLSLSTLKVSKVGKPKLGAPVKKSGRTTGLTEGTVTAEQTMEYQNIGGRGIHGFEVTSGSRPFSKGGDSGGGVFQGDTAVGVISGGPSESAPDAGKWSWVSDLDYALEKSGLEFTLTPPATAGGGATADKNASANANANAGAGSNADSSGSATAGAGSTSTASANANAAGGSNADSNGSATAGAGSTTTASANADAGAGSNSDKNASANADSNGSSSAGGSGTASANAGKNASGGSNGAGGQTPAAPVAKDQTIQQKGAVSGSATPNAQVKLEWKSSSSLKPVVEGSKTVTADSKGRFELEGPASAGVYTFTATTLASGRRSSATTFTVTVKSPFVPARRSIKVEPARISPSDFVKPTKGVTVTVSGVSAAENVKLNVTSPGKRAGDFRIDQKRNSNGTITFRIRGTKTSKAAFYRGMYQLSVTGRNSRPLTGSFTVLNVK